MRKDPQLTIQQVPIGTIPDATVGSHRQSSGTNAHLRIGSVYHHLVATPPAHRHTSSTNLLTNRQPMVDSLLTESYLRRDELSIIRSTATTTNNTPHPVRVALYYANVHPTDRSWRGDVARPFKNVPGLNAGAPPTEGTVLGVHSREELDQFLAKYRSILNRLIATREYRGAEAQALWGELFDAARLKVVGWHLDRRDGRVFPQWDTEAQTFAEMLHSYLVLALVEVAPSSIHRCTACARFYYEPSHRHVKYCSERCKKRITMQHYRARLRKQKKAGRTTEPREGSQEQA